MSSRIDGSTSPRKSHTGARSLAPDPNHPDGQPATAAPATFPTSAKAFRDCVADFLALEEESFAALDPGALPLVEGRLRRK